MRLNACAREYAERMLFFLFLDEMSFQLHKMKKKRKKDENDMMRKI